MADSKSAKTPPKSSSARPDANRSTPPKGKPAPTLVERRGSPAAAKTSLSGKPDPAKKIEAKKAQPLPLGKANTKGTANGSPARRGAPLKLPAFLEPERFGQMLHDRPAWLDEIAAIGLMVAGIVSLLSLFDASASSTLASTWSSTIRTLLGQGGALVLSLMIMGAGLMAVLPKIGIHLRLPLVRIVALEIAFGAFVALLHLTAHDPEPRALARAGGGGGYIGWAIGEVVAALFGSNFAIAVYGMVFVIGLAIALGIQRIHVRQVLMWVRARVQALLVRLTTPPPPKPVVPPPVSQTASLAIPQYPAPIEGTSPARPRKSEAPMARPLSHTLTAPSSPVPNPVLAPSLPPPPIAVPIVSSHPIVPPAPSLPEPIVARPAAPKRTGALAPKAEPPAASESIDPIAVPTERATKREPIVPRAAPPIPVRPPEPEPRPRRHFTVDDFNEVRRTLKRSPDLPPMTLLGEGELSRPSEQEINTNVRIIENTLLEFDIDVEIVDVKVGPTVTQYAVQPFREVMNAQGQLVMQRVRVNKVASLSSDLALALSAKHLRIQPYVPGHTYMGIEVPNRTPSVVALRPVMESETFSDEMVRKDPDNTNATIDVPLVLPLGRDVSGASFVTDLATMPHVLIAGTTGSGKSVCITAMIVSLVMNNLPDRVKLVMLDPKMVELTRFNGLPHLLGPVETDLERIVGVLRWATREMDRRYKLLEVEATRNIEAYNRALGKRRTDEHLPYIVIIIDEIGDLMLSRPEEVERTVTRLAQMARAVGIHLVVATQRPSVDIITGLIKANFPARISFAVASGVDSRVILDTVGAETLMGRGDMLFLASDAAGPQRLQGCYISDEELERVVDYWKQWQATQISEGGEAPAIAPWERGVTRRESLVETDPLLEEAIALVVKEGEASASQIQRQLGIDFPRAARLMENLQKLGVTGVLKADGRSREVLLKPGTDRFKKLVSKR